MGGRGSAGRGGQRLQQGGRCALVLGPLTRCAPCSPAPAPAQTIINFITGARPAALLRCSRSALPGCRLHAPARPHRTTPAPARLSPAGVALACFVFLCRLPWMIWSYGPALVRGRGCGCCCGGCLGGGRPRCCCGRQCAAADRARLPPRPRLQWSGAAFFVLCAVAAVSVVASYIGLLVGAGATATYATLSLVAAQRERLEGGGAGRRRIAYPHED